MSWRADVGRAQADLESALVLVKEVRGDGGAADRQCVMDAHRLAANATDALERASEAMRGGTT